ncbi:MAG: NAD-dependent epimerase/dehydratase family protein, partial [Rhodospirillaceae bacterium]
AVSGGSMGVFGTDYPTPDGTAVRDYIHVSDLAAAHVLALKRLLGGGVSLAVNLGTGRGWSVREVLDTVGKVVGRPIKVIEQARRAGDPPVLIADNRLAMEALGWRPELVELEDIVVTAVRWHARAFSQ